MLNRSYWEDKAFFGQPDYLVIGAGLVGMYTAYFIKSSQPESDVLVVDRGPFSNGASTKNAGFACFGSVSELIEDIDHFGREKVLKTVRMRYNGLRLTRNIFSDAAIGYNECGGIEVFRKEDAGLFGSCHDRLSEINDLVYEATGEKDVFSVRQGNPEGCKNISHHIFNRKEGSLDTGNFNLQLRRHCDRLGIRFLSGLQVTDLDLVNKTVNTQHFGPVTAGNIIVTINGFINQLINMPDVRPVRNQVMVTEVIPGWKLNGCFHLDRGYFYFREIDGRLLIGGGRNVLGHPEETDQLDTTEAAYQLLNDIITNHLDLGSIPRIEYHWSGILGVGSDKKPIIREIASGIYIGVRMGGMGVAISSLVGKELAALILDEAI